MNAEDFVITVMGLIVVGAIFWWMLTVMWQENPIMLVTCVTFGLVMSWLNGDWDRE